jgi:hypothetical protein
MKYLTEVRLATITIEDRQAIRFTVPVELAIMIFWFLASRQARLLALITWWLTGAAIRQYHGFCSYLTGWQADLSLIRLAIVRLVTDILTIQVVTAFG